MPYIKKTDNPKMGRPMTDNPLAYDLKVRIDKDTFESLQSYCKDNDKNKAEVVRIALKEYLMNNR